jgi:DNA sulfur modification protein DndB
MNLYLKKLRDIDWSRHNEENWLGRTIREDGKVMNSEEAITLTCAKIKQLIGIPLNRDEQAKEAQK